MNKLSKINFYVADVSGGKDSLYMLKLILSNPEKYPLNAVVHAELEIDFPFIKNVIDYMETECKKHNIPFYRFKPDNTWIELYKKYNFPTRLNRWCNGKYKLNAIHKIDKMFKSDTVNVIHYIGMCADEEKRVKSNKRLKYPLWECGINESVILEWAKNISIFDDYYKYNTRCGCMMCPMSDKRNMAYVAYKYPEIFEQMLKLAKNTEIKLAARYNREQFSVFASNPKYDSDYMRDIIYTKYLPKLIEEIKENKK